MKRNAEKPIEVLILAIPETAGSALYGMVDVLSATGNLWQTLVRSGDETRRFRVRILSPREQPFTCGHGIPVTPQVSLVDDPSAEIVILPEIWLGPDESLHRSCWLKPACSTAASLPRTGATRTCFECTTRRSASTRRRTWFTPTIPPAS
jgi:transcriptional regulator GlxA family with amidase domain